MKKRYEEIENENTSYRDELSSAQNEIITLKANKRSKDYKIQKALNLYNDYERQKIGLDTKSLILEILKEKQNRNGENTKKERMILKEN